MFVQRRWSHLFETFAILVDSICKYCIYFVTRCSTVIIDSFYSVELLSLFFVYYCFVFIDWAKDVVTVLRFGINIIKWRLLHDKFIILNICNPRILWCH